MPLEYSITYKAENTYETWVDDAHWQFLIIPENNITQEYVEVEFTNSLNAMNEYSVNGYGFKTIRVHPKKRFNTISFEATFRLIKREVNPFEFQPEEDLSKSYQRIQELDFKIDHDTFLKKTRFTTIPKSSQSIFQFDRAQFASTQCLDIQSHLLQNRCNHCRNNLR